jgi:hypothetical protein
LPLAWKLIGCLNFFPGTGPKFRAASIEEPQAEREICGEREQMLGLTDKFAQKLPLDILRRGCTRALKWLKCELTRFSK